MEIDDSDITIEESQLNVTTSNKTVKFYSGFACHGQCLHPSTHVFNVTHVFYLSSLCVYRIFCKSGYIEELVYFAEWLAGTQFIDRKSYSGKLCFGDILK